MKPPQPIRAKGTHFYRYQTCEHLDRLQAIILTHEIYVPTVAQLNDPTDGRPMLEPLTVQQMVPFFYEKVPNPTLTARAQARRVATIAANVAVHGQDVLMRRMSSMLYEHVKDYRIYSLSKRYDNLSLWAKYAAGHSGYCLEFANEGPFFGRAVEVIYGEVGRMDVTRPGAYFLYCKRHEWSNEEEVRVVVMRGQPATVRIEPRWLTRVILGKDIGFDNQKLICEWAKRRTPKLTVVRASFDEYLQRVDLRSCCN